MTASGVRSSWLTSASRRRRVASSDSRRAAIVLNARLEAAQLAAAARRLGDADRVVGRLDPAGRVDELRQRPADAPGEPDRRRSARQPDDEHDERRRAREVASRPSSRPCRAGSPSSHRTRTPIETIERRDQHDEAAEAAAEPAAGRLRPSRAVPAAAVPPPRSRSATAAACCRRPAVRGGQASSSGHHGGRACVARATRLRLVPVGRTFRPPARRRGSRRRRRSAGSAAGSARARACGGCS